MLLVLGARPRFPLWPALTPAATLRASFECEAEITARARRQVNHVSVLKLGFYALWFSGGLFLLVTPRPTVHGPKGQLAANGRSNVDCAINP